MSEENSENNKVKDTLSRMIGNDQVIKINDEDKPIILVRISMWLYEILKQKSHLWMAFCCYGCFNETIDQTFC